MNFDITTSNYFAGNPNTHFVMAGRAYMNPPAADYRFKGIFFAGKDFSMGIPDPRSCPQAMTSPSIYFEMVYLPSFLATCADPYKVLEDGVTYNVVMHINDAAISYWIYKGGVLWSSNGIYAADTTSYTDLVFIVVDRTPGVAFTIGITNLYHGWF